MDYVIAALKGLQAIKYVPNAMKCASNAKYSIIDIELLKYRYENLPDDSYDTKEQMFFNLTATLSGYFPDAIYYCYFIPETSSIGWRRHYNQFESLYDFEGAFIQNLAGNILTFMDIYNKTVIASRNGDFLTTIEELARFVRRVLDFKSMQRATLSD